MHRSSGGGRLDRKLLAGCDVLYCTVQAHVRGKQSIVLYLKARE